MEHKTISKMKGVLVVLTILFCLSSAYASSTYVDFYINNNDDSDDNSTDDSIEITGLRVNDKGYSWIEWEWTNPTSDNFSYSKIYIDGDFEKSTTNDSFYLDSLDEDTLYEIKIVAVDKNGKEGNAISLTTRTEDKDDDSDYYDSNGNAILLNKNTITNANSKLLTSGNAIQLNSAKQKTTNTTTGLDDSKLYFFIVFLVFGIFLLLFSIGLLVYKR